MWEWTRLSTQERHGRRWAPASGWSWGSALSSGLFTGLLGLIEKAVRCSAMSESLWPHGPTRLLCPWDSPSKNTGLGCHFLHQGIFPTQGSNLRLLSLALAGRFFKRYLGSPLWKMDSVKWYHVATLGVRYPVLQAPGLLSAVVVMFVSWVLLVKFVFFSAERCCWRRYISGLYWGSHCGLGHRQHSAGRWQLCRLCWKKLGAEPICPVKQFTRPVHNRRVSEMESRFQVWGTGRRM